MMQLVVMEVQVVVEVEVFLLKLEVLETLQAHLQVKVIMVELDFMIMLLSVQQAAEVVLVRLELMEYPQLQQ